MRKWNEKMLGDLCFLANFCIQRMENYFFNHCNAKQMKKIKKRKLTKIVRYAAENSDFYKTLYSDVDLTKEIKIEQLPIITKGDIVGQFDKMVTVNDVKEAELKKYFKEKFDFNKRFKNKYLAFHTSGSSGNPISIIWGEDVFGISLSNYFFRVKSMDNLRSVRKLKVIYIGITDDYVGGNSWVYGMKKFANIKIISVFLPENEMINELNRFQPDIIFTKPSILGKLAEKQRDGSLSIKPKRLIFAGEMINPADLKKLRQYFRIKPINSYSTCETGPVAIQSNRNSDGLEIFEDLVWVELVDDNGKVIKEYYKTGNVVLTNLYNKYFPIIRYKIGDKAYYQPCRTNKFKRELSYIQGRGTSFFTFLDKNGRHIKVAEFPFWSLYVSGIVRYQIVQTDYSGLHIKIEYENNSDNSRKEELCRQFITKLKRIIEPYQLQDIVKFSVVEEEIKMNSSGKIQVTIPLKTEKLTTKSQVLK